jgi:hypothetical protein
MVGQLLTELLNDVSFSSAFSASYKLRLICPIALSYFEKKMGEQDT